MFDCGSWLCPVHKKWLVENGLCPECIKSNAVNWETDMSIFSNVGAVAACDDIQKVIQKAQEEGLSSEEILKKVQKEITDIKSAAESGWY